MPNFAKILMSDALLRRASWLPIIVGLSVLYIPSVVDLFAGIWNTSEQFHGPIVLGIACWLAYRNWDEMWDASAGKHSSGLLGWPVLIASLLFYVIGRALGILLFEVGSVIGVLAAVLLLTRGAAALKVQWFSLFFMLFMIPLPASIVDSITLPMKIAVSYVVEHVLFAAGYSIGRSGVILQIGQYQLMVADACAGLHTLFTIEAFGLLYLKLVGHKSVARNIVLAVLMLPIALTANVIRVLALVLITYYFGDDAGQGFLHGFAGIVLFVSALGLIFTVDNLLRYCVAEDTLPADKSLERAP